ncbi:MAG: hypothetical protein IPG90_10050 [Bacteroidetes bacterium]|nr:hypothetical protein [Bacteroidota bacterium]
MNGQMSYPTSVYLDEKSDPIGPVAGYMTEKQLLPVMKYFAEDIYKTKSGKIICRKISNRALN